MSLYPNTFHPTSCNKNCNPLKLLPAPKDTATEMALTQANNSFQGCMQVPLLSVSITTLPGDSFNPFSMISIFMAKVRMQIQISLS